MDIFDEEIIKFFDSLHQNEVRYILVGGLAINFHGYNRYTGDVDIWLEDNIENRKKLRKAFIDCEMGNYPMIETMQFVPGWTEFFLNNSLKLDIMTEMKGLENYTFEECIQMASIANLSGADVPFLHINQLILNKRVVDRPKDQLDVMALEKIARKRALDNDRDSGHEPPSFSR
ncbi:hypothetical protein [Mucilaginibacter phyllosphaerae]